MTMNRRLTILLLAAFSIACARAGDSPQVAVVKEKLRTITLSDLNFQEVPLRNALDKVKSLSITADPEKDKERRGVNIVLMMDPNSAAQITITTALKQPTLGQAFAEIAKQSGCDIQIEQWGAVGFVPRKQ